MGTSAAAEAGVTSGAAAGASAAGAGSVPSGFGASSGPAGGGGGRHSPAGRLSLGRCRSAGVVDVSLSSFQPSVCPSCGRRGAPGAGVDGGAERAARARGGSPRGQRAPSGLRPEPGRRSPSGLAAEAGGGRCQGRAVARGHPGRRTRSFAGGRQVPVTVTLSRGRVPRTYSRPRGSGRVRSGRVASLSPWGSLPASRPRTRGDPSPNPGVATRGFPRAWAFCIHRGGGGGGGGRVAALGPWGSEGR